MTRPSKREIEAAVDDLKPPGEYPTVSLAALLSATPDEREDVPGRPELVRIRGTIYREPDLSGPSTPDRETPERERQPEW